MKNFNLFAIIAIFLLTSLVSAAWAAAVSLSVDPEIAEGIVGHYYVNIPCTGTNTLTLSNASVTTFKVYDNGGKNSNYSDDCDGTLVLTVPTGYVLKLSGNITTEKSLDYMHVYNGNDNSAEMLLEKTTSSSKGTQTDITNVTSSGQSMTLYFHSDYSDNYAGLDLTVTLLSTDTEYAIALSNPTTGGSVAASVGGISVTKAKLNDVVTLTASPSTGYLLNDLSVVDANNNKAVDVTWNILTNSASFIMPISAVIVTPTFTSQTSLYINMPTTGSKTVAIPAGVTSFKVYDDGGSTGDYSSKCDGTLVLTVPTGYSLQLSGNITTEKSYDYMHVYDGNTTNDTKLLDKISSPSKGTQTAITTVHSTGQSMTLYFHSDFINNYSGLDLNVTVLDHRNKEYDITVNTASGGSVAASVGGIPVTKAKVNDIVTLTVSPSTGYLLSDVSVVDANNNVVNVTWDVWSNSASFIMSTSAVVVTPTFTNNQTADDGLYINMPTTGAKTVSIPTGVQSFKVYDDGGSTGDFSENCDGTLVLTAPTGYVLQLSGNITTEKNYDNLTVYDGSMTDDTKLLDKISSPGSGSQTAITTVHSTGQSMTLYFHSDDYTNYAGLDLTVTLISNDTESNITMNSVMGGSVVASVGGTPATKVKVNDVVTLTASPSTGYLLSDISVVDANNNAVEVTWNVWTNSATFTMPASAVSVTPTFTSDLTADGGLYINMPKTGTKTIAIPAGVQSFKVYDDGGSTDNYSDNCDGTLVLTAPTDHVLKLSGNITAEHSFGMEGSIYDYMQVYDGSMADDTKLLGRMQCPSSGSQTDITTVISTGQSMTLYFYSNGSTNYDGLDLTVMVFDSNEERNITVNSATGGSVAASVGGKTTTKAKVNDVVTLTASPSTGYVLSNISVVDANGDAVDVERNWLANIATFTMPALAVTVTPTFSNNLTANDGLYINMPTTGTKTVSIPAGVTSFKVYDDGGTTGNYSDNCDGTLVLTAPTGHLLQLSGRIKTENYYDYMNVYDGSTTGNTKLLDEVHSPTNGSQAAITTVISTGQSMTLYFYSDDSKNYAGLDLTVRVFAPNEELDITMNTVTGGSIAASVGENSVTKAKFNDVVTLTASPSTGYVLSNISVVDANSNAVEVTWNLWTNSASFTMPTSAVTIVPTFSNNQSIYINMPTTGTKTVTIPAGIQSFKVYDDGGPTGDYSNYFDGTLVLTAPTDHILKLSGNITTGYRFESVFHITDPMETIYYYDYMHVYDGSTTSDRKLLNEVHSPRGGSQTAVTTVNSTGQSMTLYFHSVIEGECCYIGGNFAGLDLTVTVLDINEEHNITLNTATGGSVAASVGGNPVTKAKFNDVVTLTASPSTGYLLRNISVVDANGKAVDVEWNELTNIATFTMPISAVSVVSTFTNKLTAEGGLYINMPTTGTKTITIPAGVQSFKVYDDGGPTSNYSDNCEGYLVLTAPTDYVLQLSGNITTEYQNNYDYIRVYDGTTSDPKILDRIHSAGNGTQTDITTVISTGQSMTLLFVSNYSTNFAGLDLTVSLVPPIEYSITYNGVDGATFETTNPATYTVESENITLNNPAKDGYIFAGWTGIGLDAATTSVTIAQGSTGDRSYTATWRKLLTNTDIAIADIPDQYYTGSAICPEVVVKDGETVLELNTDYTAECSDNVNTGTASMTVTGVECYAGTVEKTFSINKVPLTVTAKAKTIAYGDDPANDGVEYSGFVNRETESVLGGSLSYAYDYAKLDNVGTYTISPSGLTADNYEITFVGGLLTVEPKVHVASGAVQVLQDQNGTRAEIDGDYGFSDKLSLEKSWGADKIEFNRSWTPGVFSTLALPFNVNTEKLGGVGMVLKFNGLKQNDVNGKKQWVVRMKKLWEKDVTTEHKNVEAYTPYMVLMNDATLTVDGEVTLETTKEPVAKVDGSDWEFHGTLAYKQWNEGDSDLGRVYGFAAEASDNVSAGQFVKAGVGAYIYPLRAYLLAPEQPKTIRANTAGSKAVPTMSLPEVIDVEMEDDDVVDNGGEPKTTVIGKFNTRTGEFKMNGAARTFDAKGRNVGNKANKARGAYYRDGKAAVTR